MYIASLETARWSWERRVSGMLLAPKIVQSRGIWIKDYKIYLNERLTYLYMDKSLYVFRHCYTSYLHHLKEVFQFSYL